MKKIFFLVVAVFVLQSANGQIVSSQSRMTGDKAKNSQWYLKAGVNIMNFSGSDADELGSNAGYNTTFGFQKPIANAGAYWGMEFGMGSRGWKFSEYGYKETFIAHNVQYSPFTFGWQYEIIDGLKIDGHLGAYVSYDYAGKWKDDDGDTYKLSDFEDYNNHDVGMNIGIGLWYRRLNFDLTYQRGFIKAEKDVKANASNFMIRLGVAF